MNEKSYSPFDDIKDKMNSHIFNEYGFCLNCGTQSSSFTEPECKYFDDLTRAKIYDDSD